MSYNDSAIERKYVGKEYQDVLDIPNLIEIQLASYERFLQAEKVLGGTKPEPQGLEEVFRTTFPVESSNGEMLLEYDGYQLDMSAIKYSEYECRQKGLTYAVPLKAKINLVFQKTGEIRQKDIYFGDVPLMTDRGTFIINGAERVVVSQIHRSPGVVFSYEKGVLSSRIIPYRGSWLEFEIDSKKDLLFVKIDRKKKILGTLFLRAIGLNSREDIIKAFYKTKDISFKKESGRDQAVNAILARSVFVEQDGKQVKLFRAGDKLHLHEIDEIIQLGIQSISIIDFGESSIREQQEIILNCFVREDMKLNKEEQEQDEPSKNDALAAVYSAIQPGEPITFEAAEKDLHSLFFSSRRYDLGKVGRYKLNKKFNYPVPLKEHTLTVEDIIGTMKYLVSIYYGENNIDDIDHLGNRRVRSVGELLANEIKKGFARMERIARERMNIKEIETIRPQDLISIKPITAIIKEFFGSSQLSQFMDQVNPLAELTHKRRLSALGTGGLSRERAGFEVRDVHYTHYGRMCPIETPEGQNIGLIVSLATYTKVNEYGFLETPYRKVENGKATDKVEYLSSMDEDRYYIGQAGVRMDKNGKFLDDLVPYRHQGDYATRSPKEVQYMDVSPKQIISVSASLIPFLEHDDANRALMGSNMQRQAVPLVYTEPPRVGTGMEQKVAYDSGVLVKAKRDGKVVFVDSTKILIHPEGKGKDVVDEYILIKYQRTNQDTCYNQRPIVSRGEKILKGQVIADGPATRDGELALGKNILAGFVPWNGYNYEDAILISEHVVREDLFTSIHIKEYIIEVRETKLGPERITRDIPNIGEKMLENLDIEGIVRMGAKVRSGDILVGKVTPKSETDTSPEFKLLNSIFGEKAKDVRDNSLKVPHGIEGTVIDIQRLKRSNNDDLLPGVEEVVKVLIAAKRKLKEGDKMAGRHGNKGIVARVLPVEEMPYLEDGTPLDICLNPLGVPSRMNIGQIMETELGWAASTLGDWYSSPVFQSPSQEMIESKLKEAGLPVACKAKVRDGRTGECFQNPVMVGIIYFMKLSHLVDDKMHARSTGPYSLVTQQPLGGKAQFGGQRLGEMEVWALEAYGASNTLQELLTIKSDDMTGRTKVYESIVKGEPHTAAGIPEAFNVMVQELRGLGLDLKIFDARGKQIPLTERDEDIINKQGSNF